MAEDVKAEIVAIVPRLRRCAWALTGSRDEGDDLVQVTCVKALGALDQYRPGTRVEAWMMRILYNGWIDRSRSRSRHAAVTVADPEAVDALSDAGLGARTAEARLELMQVRRAMGRLASEQRAVLGLVAIEGLSYREAAEALDIPVGTVMSRLGRARARLSAMMEEDAP